jgi:hypothetical protein
MRDKERWIIRLEFKRKNIKTIIIRAETSQPQLKLSSFNYQARLAQARTSLCSPTFGLRQDVA